MSSPPPARRWTRTALEWALTLAALAAGLVAVGWLRAPDLPEDAPPLRLPTLDGDLVDLADLRGRPVVLNFWATWCGPCRAEMPLLTSWAAGRDDVVVLTVSTDRDPRPVRRWRDDLEPATTILLADAATQRAWGVSTLPTTVVVDAEGKIHAAHTGVLLPGQLSWMVP